MPTLDIFIERLTNETPREWVIENGAIRIAHGPLQECPISAVAGGGEKVFIDPVGNADKAGLTAVEARDIRDASDDPHVSGGYEPRHTEEEHRVLRDRILVACELELGL